MSSSNLARRRCYCATGFTNGSRDMSRAEREGAFREAHRSPNDTRRCHRSRRRSDRVAFGMRRNSWRWPPRGAVIAMFACLFAAFSATGGGVAMAEEARQVIRRGHLINSGAEREIGSPREIEPPIVALRFDWTPIDCQSLDQIARPHELQLLWLNSARFTDSDLSFLARTPRLENLQLPGYWDAPYARISDVGLKHISQLRHLNSLTLGSNRITDRGLAQLVGLWNLRFLYLRSSNITDAGIARLGDMPSLALIGLRAPKMTDLSIMQLSRLEHLAWLDVCGTSVTGLGFAVDRCPPFLSVLTGNFTDDGLKCISKLGAGLPFGKLQVVGDQVTDEGLVSHVRAPRLTTLSLYDTRVTPEGVAAFRRANPLTKHVTVANGGQRPTLYAAERLSGAGRAPISRHVRQHGVPALRMRSRPW